MSSQMSGKTRSFRARRILIVDSTPASDFQSGKHLADRLSEFPDSVCEVIYAPTATLDEFKHALKEAGDAVPTHGVPILHIASHGDEEGFQFASGESHTWTEISESIRSLNIATRCNLLVTIASCYGFHAATMNEVSWDRSCYWCLLGRPDEHSIGDFTNDYVRFYRTLLATYDFGKALDAINESNRGYSIYGSEHLFKLTIQAYVREHWVSAARYRVQMKKKARLESKTITIGRAQLESRIEEARWSRLLEWRRTFFMIDLCPENESRFMSEKKLTQLVNRRLGAKKRA